MRKINKQFKKRRNKKTTKEIQIKQKKIIIIQ